MDVVHVMPSRNELSASASEIAENVVQTVQHATTHDDNHQEKRQELLSNRNKVVMHLISGATAGAVAKTCIAPLDRTKINFQIQNKPFTYREAYNFVVESYRQLGVKSLWRGNSATMARIIPNAAIQYTAHEQWKVVLRVDTHKQRKKYPIRSFLAGSLAGVVSNSITYPLDLARARMAITHKERYTSLRHVFVMILREEGARSFYRGYLPTLLGVIPYAGTGFYTYETLKRLHNEYTHREEPNPVERIVFGGTAGLLGQFASYPLDIVRRRMQTAQLTGNSYRTIRGTVFKVVREEGLVKGMYKGFSLNCVKGPIAAGLSFTTFDLTHQTLRKLPCFTT